MNSTNFQIVIIFIIFFSFEILRKNINHVNHLIDKTYLYISIGLNDCSNWTLLNKVSLLFMYLYSQNLLIIYNYFFTFIPEDKTKW